MIKKEDIEFVNNNLDLAFKHKEPTKKLVNKSDKIDEKNKKIANFALDHEKLTRDVVNFGLEYGEDLSNNIQEFSSKEKNMTNCAEFAEQNKEPIQKSVDITFENKDAIKDAMEHCDDQNLKKVSEFALEHEKFTKDVVNLTLEEGKYSATTIDDFSKKDKNVMDYVGFVADMKRPIQKSVDTIFENKYTMKEIVDKKVEDKTLKSVVNFALENEKLTKGVINFGLNTAEFVDDNCSIF